MDSTATWLYRLGARISRRPASVRLAVGVLVALAIVGAVLLLVGTGTQALLPVSSDGLDASTATRLETRLAQRGIRYERQGQLVLVGAEDLSLARGLLERVDETAPDLTAAFERLTEETSIWTSQGVQAQRWQAAKMRTLSRLIEMFPDVESCTVLFEPGQPAGLGRAHIAPTASVKVALREDRPLDSQLVAAIADQVAGTIQGMQRQHVRIIDNVGRSYRVGEPDAPAIAAATAHPPQPDVVEPVDRFAALASGEAYYRRQVLQALEHVPGLVVGVKVRMEEGAPVCRGAWISVPQSYVQAVQAARGQDAPADAPLDEAFAALAGRLQRAVAGVLGLDDVQSVQIDWHPDLPEVTTAGPVVPDAPPVGADADRVGWMMMAMGLAAGLLLGAGWLSGRRGRRQTGGEAPVLGRAMGQGVRSDPMRFLRELPAQQAAELLAPEHPQTVALVLSQLPSLEAGQILTSFDADVQQDIARRMSALEDVEPALLRELARELRDRLGEGCLQPGDEDAPAATGDDFDELCQVPQAVLRRALTGCAPRVLAEALHAAGEETKAAVLSAVGAETSSQAARWMGAMDSVGIAQTRRARAHVMQCVRKHLAGMYEPVGASEE